MIINVKNNDESIQFFFIYRVYAIWVFSENICRFRITRALSRDVDYGRKGPFRTLDQNCPFAFIRPWWGWKKGEVRLTRFRVSIWAFYARNKMKKIKKNGRFFIDEGPRSRFARANKDIFGDEQSG